MNLHENIQKIRGLMITEGKKGVINSMIDKHGLLHTIKILGGYDKLKRMGESLKLSKWQKIQLIRDVVNKTSEQLGSNGFGIADTYESPIFVGDNDEVTSQIEYFTNDYVYIDVYYNDTDAYKGEITINYENLDESILDDVFEFMLKVNDEI